MTTTDNVRKERWSDQDTIMIEKVPYEKEEYWQVRVLNITEQVSKMSSISEEYFKKFASDQLALFLYDLNRMEGTIPVSHNNGSTIAKIKSFLEDSEREPTIAPWCSEGGRVLDSDSSNRQLYQCSKAARFLFFENSTSSLSAELIIQVHKIMMENSYQEERKVKYDVEVGKWRSTEVNAGMYQFVPASAVARATKGLISFYESERSRNYHPINLATLLFYELITIHPFQNGNGRLCRMFFAWSLLRDGFPFVTSFSSGHRKKRQHYLHAIQRARIQDSGTRGELNVIAVLSIERILDHYMANLCHLTQPVAQITPNTCEDVTGSH